jgi:hypothetical protein
MTTQSELETLFYVSNIEHYVTKLPLWRMILARYFEKYKVTKQEYDKWFYSNMLLKKQV